MLTLKLATLLILTLPLPLLTVPQGRAETGFPLTIVDDFGRNVTVKAPPQRIVSTAPSNTEILFALGLGDRVVGVTTYCDYPPVVKERVQEGEITTIGGYADPSLEGVISLNPDLVLAATDLQFEFVSTLQNRKVVVVALNPKTVDDIIHDLALVGTLCGSASQANALIDNIQRRFRYISDRIAGNSTRPKVYYELWYDPLMSFGSSTLVDELISKAGGDNIFHDSPTMYPIVNSEMIIQKDPDLIIVSEEYMGGVTGTDFEKRAGWNTIKAVNQSSIYTVNEDIMVRQGPRIIDGLEDLASIIHPDAFTGAIQYNSSIIVTSNSSVFALIYDNAKSLLNFSIIGRGTSASIKVDIDKKLLKGSPVVLIDGVEKAVSFSENQTAFAINFTTSLSRHTVVLGGSQTVPEFGQYSTGGILLFTLTAVLLIAMWKSRFHSKRQLIKCQY